MQPGGWEIWDGACVRFQGNPTTQGYGSPLSPPWPPRRRLLLFADAHPSSRGHACVRTRKLTHTQALRSLQTQAPPVPSTCFFRRQAVLGPRSWLVRPLRRHSVWLGRRSRIVGWYGVSRVLNRRQGGGGCRPVWLVFCRLFVLDPGEPWCRLWCCCCCCCCSVVRPQCRCGRTRSPLIASADGGEGNGGRPTRSRPVVLQGELRESRGVVLAPEPTRSIQHGIFVAGVLVTSGPLSHDFQACGGERRAGGRKVGVLGKSDPAGSCVYAWLQNERARLVC